MNDDQIVKTVQLLERHDKVTVIDRLLQGLDPYQFRDLDRLGNCKRDMRKDIIGSLPSELVHCVFAQLSFLDAFKYQCVSSRWRQVLSDPQLLQTLLRPHMSRKETQRLANTSLSRSALNAVYCNRAMRVTNFIRFRPMTTFTASQYADVSSSAESPASMPRRLTVCTRPKYGERLKPWAFFDDALLFVCGEDRTRSVYYNFRTKEKRVFSNAGRQKAKGVALSRSHAAILHNNGRCSSFDLSTSESSYFQLPSANFHTLHIRDHLIVITIHLNDIEHNLEMLIWDCNEKKLRQVRMDSYISEFLPEGSPKPFTMVISPESDTVGLFVLPGRPWIRSLRYLRQSLASGAVEHTDWDGDIRAHCKAARLEAVPCNDEDHYIVPKTWGSNPQRPSLSTHPEITPDGTMVERKYEIGEGPRNDNSFEELWWNDTMHAIDVDPSNAKEDSSYTNIYGWDSESQSYQVKERRAFKLPFWSTKGAEFQLEPLVVAGNNKMVLVLTDDVIQGYSFDPEIDISGAASVFEESIDR